MSKAKAKSRDALTLSLTDNHEIHPQALVNPNRLLKWFLITFVTFAVTLLICTTFQVIFQENGGILITMLCFTFVAVNYECFFFLWRRWYLSHYLKHHGTWSLANVILTVPFENGKLSVSVEFPLHSSNDTACSVGTKDFFMTEEAYNNAIQSHGGIPTLFEAFAKPPTAIHSDPNDDWLHHGIAIPAEGEPFLSLRILILLIISTTATIFIFFLIWVDFQEALDASKEEGMEWLLPIFYLLLGIHFIILHWAFWTAVTGHAGLEYKYKKSKSDAEWKE